MNSSNNDSIDIGTLVVLVLVAASVFIVWYFRKSWSLQRLTSIDARIGLIAVVLLLLSVFLPWISERGVSLTMRYDVGGQVVREETLPAVPYRVIGYEKPHGVVVCGLAIIYLIMLTRTTAWAKTALLGIGIVTVAVLISFIPSSFRGPDSFCRGVGVGFILECACACAFVACGTAAKLKRKPRFKGDHV